MNLYIGNLSPETSESSLKKLFSEFGEIVSLKIMIDNATGLPRGFGFVEMADKFHAFDAIDNIDGTFFEGSVISVKEAKQKPQGGAGGGRKGFSRGPRRDGNSFGGGGSYQRREGGYQPREGGTGGFQRREGGTGGYQRREGGTGGFQRREGGTGGYQRREGGTGGFQRREGGTGGYQRREGGTGGYQRRDDSNSNGGNFNRNNDEKKNTSNDEDFNKL